MSGIRWTGVNKGVQSALALLITVMLARLLQPEDFGLVAMATIFTIFMGFFNEFGSGSAIIQKQGLGQREISSIFWFNLLVGLITTIVTVIVAPFIAMFFKEPRLGPILVVLSFTFFLSSLYNVHQAQLVKNLEFRFLYIVRISCTISSGLLAIILAYKGYGVWSLVWQAVAEELFTLILLWIPYRWYPLMHFRWSEVRLIMNFSMNYLGFNIVNFISERLPHLLIGKFLGSESLGFYTLAQRIVAFPLETTSYITGNVLFPVFSRIQDDNLRIGELYLHAMKHVGFIIFPLMVGLFITAPELIQIVFGLKWMPAIFILQVLSVAGILQSISINNSVLYLTKGRTDLQFMTSLLFLLVMAMSIYIGTNWGIRGVAISYVIASFIIIYPSLVISYGVVNLKVYRLLQTLKEAFMITAVMGIPLFVIAPLLRSMWVEPFLILTSSILTGGVIYIICSFLLNRKLLTSFYDMLNLRA